MEYLVLFSCRAFTSLLFFVQEHSFIYQTISSISFVVSVIFAFHHDNYFFDGKKLKKELLIIPTKVYVENKIKLI